MGKLLRRYKRLFESTEQWLDAFSKISIHGLEEFQLYVSPCDDREWCIEINSEDPDKVERFLDFINDKYGHSFTLEYNEGDIFIVVCNDHINESEEDEEEEISSEEDTMDSEEDEDGGMETIPIELDSSGMSDDEYIPSGSEADMLMDSPADNGIGIEKMGNTIDDFDTFSSKKDLKGTMDIEGKMAKSQLGAMKDHIEEILSMLDENDELPAWIQSKLTLADAYIDEIYHRMKH